MRGSVSQFGLFELIGDAQSTAESRAQNRVCAGKSCEVTRYVAHYLSEKVGHNIAHKIPHFLLYLRPGAGIGGPPVEPPGDADAGDIAMSDREEGSTVDDDEVARFFDALQEAPGSAADRRLQRQIEQRDADEAELLAVAALYHKVWRPPPAAKGRYIAPLQLQLLVILESDPFRDGPFPKTDELAHMLGVKATTVTSALTALRDKDLIDPPEANPGDRRRRDRHARARGEADQIVRELLDRAGPELRRYDKARTQRAKERRDRKRRERARPEQNDLGDR